MGMHEGRARIGKLIREVVMKWSELRMNWDDANSHAFEEKYIRTLEEDGRTALSTMDHMAQILQQVKRDCG